MIVDREGDLVVTEDGSLMLNVGGFLLKPKPKELHERSDWVYALMVRRGQRVVPADPPPASFQAAWIEPPPEIFPSLARAEPRPGGVTKRAGTLLLLDLTEQQQLDSCTGR